MNRPTSSARAIPPLTGLVAFFVYLKTLSPSLPLGDAGELIAASHNLGIAHPPGYPMWCLVSRLAEFIPFGNIAFRTNLSSAILNSIAVGLIAAVALMLTRSTLAACTASLALAFSTTFWAQSGTSDLYALNTFFLAVIIYVLARWFASRDNRYLLATAFTLGLSLAHHTTMVLAIPAFVYLVVRHWRGRAGVVKTLSAAIVLLLLGGLAQAYMPIRAATAPAINWGDPSTFDAFFAHATRAQYGGIHPERFVGILQQLVTFFALARDQFGYLFCALAVVGALAMRRRYRPLFQTSLILFLLSGPVYCVLLTGLLFGEQLIKIDVYYLPAFVVVAIWGALGIAATLGWVVQLARGASQSGGWLRQRQLAGIAVVCFLVLPLIGNYHPNDLSRNRITYQYGENLLQTFERGAIFLGQGDYEFFSMAYLQEVEGKRKDITVLDINDLGEHDIYWKPSPDLVQVLDSGQRPVCAAIKKSFFRGLRFIPCGLVYRVLTGEQASLLRDRLLVERTAQFGRYEVADLRDPAIHLGHFMQILAANYPFFRIEYLLESGRYEEALGLAHWLMGRDYSPKQVYNNLGSALAERGFNEEAAEAYREALARDPLYRSALINLASVKRQLGNDRTADALRGLALPLSPRRYD